MIAPWRSPAQESPGRRLLLAPLVPIATGYGLAARLHRASYASGWLPQARLPCRVVSVGSLSVGGAAKTPTAAWLAHRLAREGMRVALASRGHARRGGDAVTIVSDGRRVLADLHDAGDEALVLASHAPGVPVLVGRDRARVGRRAAAAFDCEVLVLDDGFQHHRLARDLDLLVFDGNMGLGNRAVLPRGSLREPLAALECADAIGVIDGPISARDDALLRELAPDAFRFAGRRQPVSLRPLRGGHAFVPETLRGVPVGMLCGIGSPDEFRRTLEVLGARVVATRIFSDHHHYRARDLRGLSRIAPIWATSEKDAVKLHPDWVRGLDVRVLRIELEPDDPNELVAFVRSRLQSSAQREAVKRDAQTLASESREQLAS